MITYPQTISSFIIPLNVQFTYFSVPFFQGVSIPMLGTFTFTQKKLDIGNNKFIMMQRPIFMLSEKFAQTHGLQSVKYHVPGEFLSYLLLCNYLDIYKELNKLLIL